MMLIQTFDQVYKYRNTSSFDPFPLKHLPTDVSYQFLGRKLEVVSLNDSSVESGQPTEIKTKNLGNNRLDIETDLKEFDKEKFVPKN
jgi:hypothetical protein